MEIEAFFKMQLTNNKINFVSLKLILWMFAFQIENEDLNF